MGQGSIIVTGRCARVRTARRRISPGRRNSATTAGTCARGGRGGGRRSGPLPRRRKSRRSGGRDGKGEPRTVWGRHKKDAAGRVETVPLWMPEVCAAWQEPER